MRATSKILLAFSIAFTSQPAFSFTNLSVPFFSQFDNKYEPSATCGITSGTMAMNSFLPSHTTPDKLYIRYGKPQGQSPEGLAQIYRWEGFYAKSSRTGTRAQIKQHLDAGRPVVVHGWFTGNGHIITIRGYNNQGFIVNDPAGDWTGCYQCGHSSSTGENIVYSYAEMSDSVLSYDGDIWYSTLDIQPF